MAIASKQIDAVSKLAAAVRDEITRANDSDLKENRELALDYNYGRRPPAPGGGLSGVVSMDVADAINAITAQLLPMISTDAVVEFEADGAQDEQAATAESAVVNEVIIEDNNGFLALEECIRDALLLRIGVAKIWVDEMVDVQNLRWDDVSDEELNILLAPTAANEARHLISREGTAAEIRVTLTTREFRFRSVDPTQFMYRANWISGQDLEDCPFVAERLYLARYELKEMGYDPALVDELPNVAQPRNTDGRQRDVSAELDFVTDQKDLEFVECHECYYHWHGELLKVFLGGENTILGTEPVEIVPYAVGACILRQHRLTGESVFDKLRGVQDGKTAALRQWIDNLTIANQARVIINEANVNLADALDSKPGGVVRARDVSQVVPFPFIDTGPSNLALLQYFDEVRTEAVGAALDMQSAPAQLANVAASVVERQYSSKELVVAMFAKNFAETLIRRAWLLMHATLRLYSNEPINMKLAGEWQEVDAAGWPARTKLNVRTGMTVGQRTHAQQTLQQAMLFQQQAMAQGRDGVLASNETLHRSYLDWLTMAGLENPGRYAIDPASPEAQAAAQANAETAQQAQQAQQQLIGAQVQIEAGKAQETERNNKAEIDFKYYNANLDAEIDEAKLVGEATLDLERAQMQGEQNEHEREASAGNGASRDRGDN